MTRPRHISFVLSLCLVASAGLAVTAHLKSEDHRGPPSSSATEDDQRPGGTDTSRSGHLPVLPLEATAYLRQGDRLTFTDDPELLQIYASLDDSPIEVHQGQGVFWLIIPDRSDRHEAKLLIDQLFQDSSTAQLSFATHPPSDDPGQAVEPLVSTGVVASLLQLNFTDFTVLPPDESAGRGPSSLVCSADGTALILDGAASRVARLASNGTVRTARALPSQWFTALITNPSKSSVVALDLFNLQALDIETGQRFNLPEIWGYLPARVEYQLGNDGLLAARSPTDNQLYAALQLGNDGSSAPPLSGVADGPRWWSTETTLHFQQSDQVPPVDVHIPGGNWQTIGHAEAADGRIILLGTTGPVGRQPTLLVIDHGAVEMYLIKLEVKSWNVASEFMPSIAICNGNARIIGASESHLLVIDVAI